MFLSTVGKYFRYFVSQAAINYSSAMEFKASFLILLVGGFLFEIAFLYLSVALFSHYPQINGWTLQQHIVLLAVGWGAIDMVFCVASGVIDFSRHINAGSLDQYLLYPIHPLIMLLMGKVRITSLGTMAAVFLFLHWSGLMSVSTLLLFGLAIILGAIIFISFMVIIQTVCFFVPVGAGLARQIMICLFNFMYVPPTVYRGALLLLTKTLFPSFFIAFLPAQLVMNFSWTDCGLLCGVAAGSALFAVWFFNRGLRKYESG